MTDQELSTLLGKIQSLEAENEIVEFKEAKNNYDFNKIGKYFSALSNEANLGRKEYAWLVFGVENTNHKVVGTSFRPNKSDLNSLKKEIADKTNNRITFIEIYELNTAEGRVILFQIPPAPHGIPVSFDGHFYGRDSESLSPLNIEELERIRFQGRVMDWSAGIVNEATIHDLDQNAISKARIEFQKRNPKYRNEVELWEDSKFLDKAKITIKGKITRTALILLGKDESEHFINPFVAKIRWNLKTIGNEDKDYEVFSMPFILTVDEVYGKIRNLKYRYLREGTLFPDEVLRYEPFNIRESLHNAIAHQDYTKGARINVVEYEDDHLIFSNYGSFIPVKVENVVLNDSPEEFYRNPFLVEAMKNLDMIETQGGGIRKIFNYQRARFFPMPDYNFEQNKVKVTITGKVLDEEFARILILNPKLSLHDIISLDKVQKRKPIEETEGKHLKKLGLIEGRKPNFYLSKTAIIPTDNPDLKAEYLRNRGLNDTYLKKYLLDYLKMGKAKKSKIDAFIWDKLSNVLDEKKKKNKIKNLLQDLRKEGKVRSPEYGVWEIV